MDQPQDGPWKSAGTGAPAQQRCQASPSLPICREGSQAPGRKGPGRFSQARSTLRTVPTCATTERLDAAEQLQGSRSLVSSAHVQDERTEAGALLRSTSPD